MKGLQEGPQLGEPERLPPPKPKPGRLLLIVGCALLAGIASAKPKALLVAFVCLALMVGMSALAGTHEPFTPWLETCVMFMGKCIAGGDIGGPTKPPPPPEEPQKPKEETKKAAPQVQPDKLAPGSKCPR